mmetsp:Transcript_79791/g.229024  ORF Transcript_79791/g.229024 Transcript_79791/m.229024 type:complete len:219 (+) Transcript_79791:832-1488(+)
MSISASCKPFSELVLSTVLTFQISVTSGADCGKAACKYSPSGEALRTHFGAAMIRRTCPISPCVVPISVKKRLLRGAVRDALTARTSPGAISSSKESPVRHRDTRGCDATAHDGTSCGDSRGKVSGMGGLIGEWCGDFGNRGEGLSPASLGGGALSDDSSSGLGEFGEGSQESGVNFDSLASLPSSMRTPGTAGRRTAQLEGCLSSSMALQLLELLLA